MIDNPEGCFVIIKPSQRRTEVPDSPLPFLLTKVIQPGTLFLQSSYTTSMNLVAQLMFHSILMV